MTIAAAIQFPNFRWPQYTDPPGGPRLERGVILLTDSLYSDDGRRPVGTGLKNVRVAERTCAVFAGNLSYAVAGLERFEQSVAAAGGVPSAEWLERFAPASFEAAVPRQGGGDDSALRVLLGDVSTGGEPRILDLDSSNGFEARWVGSESAYVACAGSASAAESFRGHLAAEPVSRHRFDFGTWAIVATIAMRKTVAESHVAVAGLLQPAIVTSRGVFWGQGVSVSMASGTPHVTQVSADPESLRGERES